MVAIVPVYTYMCIDFLLNRLQNGVNGPIRAQIQFLFSFIYHICNILYVVNFTKEITEGQILRLGFRGRCPKKECLQYIKDRRPLRVTDALLIS